MATPIMAASAATTGAASTPTCMATCRQPGRRSHTNSAQLRSNWQAHRQRRRRRRRQRRQRQRQQRLLRPPQTPPPRPRPPNRGHPAQKMPRRRKPTVTAKNSPARAKTRVWACSASDSCSSTPTSSQKVSRWTWCVRSMLPAPDLHSFAALPRTSREPLTSQFGFTSLSCRYPMPSVWSDVASTTS